MKYYPGGLFIHTLIVSNQNAAVPATAKPIAWMFKLLKFNTT